MNTGKTPPRCLAWVEMVFPIFKRSAVFSRILATAKRTLASWPVSLFGWGPFLRPGLRSSGRRTETQSRMALGPPRKRRVTSLRAARCGVTLDRGGPTSLVCQYNRIVPTHAKQRGTGKTLFAQIMDFLPWSTFDRIVARYDGNRGVRKLSCAAQYQIMAFAQLTYRESLRDIEACLSAQRAKLYHMGFREPVRRSTLADAAILNSGFAGIFRYFGSVFMWIEWRDGRCLWSRS
jgi:Domain of unknown function (DUF4372)